MKPYKVLSAYGGFACGELQKTFQSTMPLINVFSGLTIIAFFVLFLFCTTVSAGYKIILKNGKDFIVNDYKEVDGWIRFYKAGGQIEISKDDIADIKQVKATDKTEGTAPAETIKKDSTEGLASPAEKGKDTQAQKLEAEKRLREIAKTKEEMKAEGEKLIEEKKKLEETIKKEGNVLYFRKEREYKQKIQEIEDKIKKFNEEVSKLDTEQEKLMKVLQESQKEQQR